MEALSKLSILTPLIKIFPLSKLYIFNNNLHKEEYNWTIEGQGRLHKLNNQYLTYTQQEIVQDGSISMVIVINN